MVEPKKLLMVGGPQHGEEREELGDVLTVWFQATQFGAPPGSPALSTHYRRRPLTATRANDGVRFVRSVYVHEDLTPEEFGPAFTNLLLGFYIMGGDQVESDPSTVVPGRAAEGTGPVEGGQPRTTSGLYLP